MLKSGYLIEPLNVTNMEELVFTQELIRNVISYLIWGLIAFVVIFGLVSFFVSAQTLTSPDADGAAKDDARRVRRRIVPMTLVMASVLFLCGIFFGVFSATMPYVVASGACSFFITMYVLGSVRRTSSFREKGDGPEGEQG